MSEIQLNERRTYQIQILTQTRACFDHHLRKKLTRIRQQMTQARLQLVLNHHRCFVVPRKIPVPRRLTVHVLRRNPRPPQKVRLVVKALRSASRTTQSRHSYRQYKTHLLFSFCFIDFCTKLDDNVLAFNAPARCKILATRCSSKLLKF
jgi:hypothetical protein